MLVLSRKTNESVVLDIERRGPATVTVIEIRGYKVRLGFTAPKEWVVHRQEVWDAIHGSEPGGVVPPAAPPPPAQTPHPSADDLARYAALSVHLEECAECRLAFSKMIAPPATP